MSFAGSIVLQGLLLGLASGAACLAYCAPVLVPCLLGEGRSIGGSYGVLTRYIGGRLFSYLLLGVLAWQAGSVYAGPGGFRFAQGLLYLVLASLLLAYGLSVPGAACAAGKRGVRSFLAFLAMRRPGIFPVALGAFTGFSLCPPVLAAFTGAAGAGTLVFSLLYFFSFFLGSLLYMIPLPLLGVFSRLPPLSGIGRLSAAVVSVYYLYLGIVNICSRS